MFMEGILYTSHAGLLVYLLQEYHMATAPLRDASTQPDGMVMLKCVDYSY